jgi:hypothetical protein
MPTVAYKNKAKARIPSQSAIKSQIGWGSGPLSYWHWKQGHEGVEWKDIYKAATTPGTIAHLMIECHLKGIEPDLKEFTVEHLEQAYTAFEGFLSWQKQWEVVPLYIEPNLVSEIYQFGGTPDLLCTVKKKPALADWKTGKVYEVIFVQLEAYRRLIKENYGIDVEEYHVLRIPKNEDVVSFHHHRWDKLPESASIAFDSALALHKCEKELKKYL